MAIRKNVREGEEFFFCTGEFARNITECCDVLETISGAAFRHHVNEHNNDIYTWIKNCIDPDIAERIQYSTDKDLLIKELIMPKPNS